MSSKYYVIADGFTAERDNYEDAVKVAQLLVLGKYTSPGGTECAARDLVTVAEVKAVVRLERSFSTRYA